MQAEPRFPIRETFLLLVLGKADRVAWPTASLGMMAMRAMLGIPNMGDDGWSACRERRVQRGRLASHDWRVEGRV
jgi:hypothetical protein